MINLRLIYQQAARSVYTPVYLINYFEREAILRRHIAPMGWNLLSHAKFHPWHGCM